MVTVTDFLVRLVTSAIELVVTFVTEVAVQDPLSFVSFLFGAIFVGGASAFFGYLVVGALFDELGLQMPSPGRGTREGRGRVPTRPPNPDAERETAGAGRARQQE
ncbi:MAG: hypothetical protein ABEI99_07025 [Halobaculum sp.]